MFDAFQSGNKLQAGSDHSCLHSHSNKRGPNSASLLGLVNNRKTGRGFTVGSEVGCYASRDMSQNVTER